MLRRKAGLAGILVVEVWGGYSTTIGNSAFERASFVREQTPKTKPAPEGAGGN
jgi:hypothetical protein